VNTEPPATPGSVTPDAAAPDAAAPDAAAPDAAAPDAAAGDRRGRPQRLHPISPVVDLLAWVPRLWVPALLLVSRPYGPLLLLGGVGLLLATRVVAWWRTTWSFDGRELVVDSGWLQRTTRTVPIARLQQVEVVRKLRHQLVGVAELRVHLASAGVGDTDVRLEVLSLSEAQALRATMEDARRGVAVGADVAAAVPAPPAHEVLRLTPGLLALGGLTGATLLFVPAALMALAGQLDDLGVDDDVERTADRLSLGWLAAVVTIVSVLAAVGISVVRHHGLRVSRRTTDLVFERGLFERRSSVMPLARVQVVRVHRNVVRGWFGLASVDIATGGHVRTEGAGSMDDTVPVARWDDACRVAEVALDQRPVAVADRPTVRAGRLRLVLDRALLAVVVTVWIPPVFGQAWAAVPAVVVAATVLVGIASARTRRHGIGSHVLVVEGGALVWSRHVVPLDRVQSWQCTQGPLQRRLGLADVAVHVAGQAPVQVVDASESQADELRRVLAATAR
jgi:putative membrane protein